MLMLYVLYSSWLPYCWKGIILTHSDTNTCCGLCLALLEISSKVSVCSLQSRILQALSNNYVPLNDAIEVWNTCTSLNYKTTYKINFQEKAQTSISPQTCMLLFTFEVVYIFAETQNSRVQDHHDTMTISSLKPPLCSCFKELMWLAYYPNNSRKSMCLLFFLNSMLIQIMVMSIFKGKKKSETKFWGGQCPPFTLPHF